MRTSPYRIRALVCVCAILTQFWVQAQEDVGLEPEGVAKCTEFLKKVVAARRKNLDKRMADEIVAVTKTTGLDPARVKSLEAAAVTAGDAAQADLLTRSLDLYLKAYARMGGRGLRQLDQPGVVETLARSDSGFDAAVHYTRALDQPAWKDALAAALTPEQAAVWQKAQEAKIGTVAKELDDMLDRQTDQVRAALTSPMFTKSTEIIDALDLPKERADAVNDLAKKAVDASMNAWRKDARQTYLSNDETTRARVSRGLPFYSPPQAENAPDHQIVWTQGIDKLLSADERGKLELAHATQRQRRAHALAMLMLMLMDDKVAFTAAQRPKLEPITERLVQKLGDLYPAGDNNNEYFSLSPVIFYQAAAGANTEELRAIIDDLQCKRWREASRAKVPPSEGEEEDAQPLSAPAKPNAGTVEEPEESEQLVSDYLAGKAADRHKELDAAMLLQAEDAARVAGLPPETVARLRTAALGAAEMALANWSASFEMNVRNQVLGATRETLPQRLSGANQYSLGQPITKEQAIWRQVMRTDLTQAQQDAWKSERDARARYGDEAVAQFLLAEFNRGFALSAGQWERLTPMLAKAIHDYRPDIGRMFSDNSPQWYLTGYYMFLPMHAIPENDCKAILGKERYDRWTESNGYRYSSQYWSSLKEYHEQRTREERE